MRPTGADLADAAHRDIRMPRREAQRASGRTPCATLHGAVAFPQ
jgi:hypothetical protein